MSARIRELINDATDAARHKAKLADRIKGIALSIAADYPEIETKTTWEQLYAIEESYRGAIAANNDLHTIIRALRSRYDIPLSVIFEIDKEIDKSRE